MKSGACRSIIWVIDQGPAPAHAQSLLMLLLHPCGYRCVCAPCIRYTSICSARVYNVYLYISRSRMGVEAPSEPKRAASPIINTALKGYESRTHSPEFHSACQMPIQSSEYNKKMKHCSMGRRRFTRRHFSRRGLPTHHTYLRSSVNGR